MKGLDYADQRWYVAGTGWFLTADPFVSDCGKKVDGALWNRISYVGSDPVNYLDETGLYREEPKYYPGVWLNGQWWFYGGAGDNGGGGGRPLSTPTDFARAYGWIGSTDSLSRDSIDWNQLLRSFAFYIENGHVQNAATTVLLALLTGGSATISIDQATIQALAPLAVPIIIVTGEQITQWTTVTVVLAAILEVLTNTRNPKCKLISDNLFFGLKKCFYQCGRWTVACDTLPDQPCPEPTRGGTWIPRDEWGWCQ